METTKNKQRLAFRQKLKEILSGKVPHGVKARGMSLAEQRKLGIDVSAVAVDFKPLGAFGGSPAKRSKRRQEKKPGAP